MTPATDSPALSPATAGPAPTSALDGVRFQVDYLDAKLSEIGARYAEDLPEDLVHDLHSAWDAIQ